MSASEPKAAEKKNPPGIFISYRRSDTPDAVGRIYDRLVSEFGKARVFKDVDSIPLGQDFRGHLNDSRRRLCGSSGDHWSAAGPTSRNKAGQTSAWKIPTTSCALSWRRPWRAVSRWCRCWSAMRRCLGLHSCPDTRVNGVSAVDRSAAGSGFSQ